MPSRNSSPLPTEAELAEWYAAYRARYFLDDAGRPLLPPADEVQIEWSSRLSTAAGLCYPRRRLIRLSREYHARFPDDVGATLLHEMIHLLVPGHGPPFYAWMERIRARGGRVSRYPQGRAKAPRYRYTCRGCGASFTRYRRMNFGGARHFCRACGPELGRLEETPLAPS